MIKRILAIYTISAIWQIFPMEVADLIQVQYIPLPESIAFPLTGEQYSVFLGGHLADGYRQKISSRSANMFEFGAKRLLLLEFANQVKIFGSIEQNLFCAIALCQWCRYKAERVLPSLLLSLAKSADSLLSGSVITCVDVRDQSSRWASCSVRRNKDGQANVRIHFNWRALLLPSALAHHLCWHELCHIRQPNHGKEFKSLLASFSPASASYEKALNTAWRAMPAWALSTLMARGFFKIRSRKKPKTQQIL